MPSFPTSASGLNYITYPASDDPTGSVATSSGSANTKGSYTQIVASLGFSCVGLIVFSLSMTNTGNLFLADIATGAGGAEVVLLPNIPFVHSGTTSANACAQQWFFPVAITSTTRVSHRVQSDGTSKGDELSFTFYATNGAIGVTATPETSGSDTATSQATDIDPGGTANTKGSYVQLKSSTGQVYQWVNVMMSWPGHGNSGGFRYEADIATGAGGAEVVLIPNLRARTATTWVIGSPSAYYLPTYIAASTRIAARLSSTTNTATSRLLQLAIMGGAAPAEAGGGSTYVLGSRIFTGM